MAFQIALYKTNKTKNSTKVPPITAPNTYMCNLKLETSILRPIFQLQIMPDEINFTWNYCYCPEFERYYYITDIIQESGLIWNIHCTVDVLATYHDAIHDTEGFVYYAESKYNSMLPDHRVPRTDDFDVHYYNYPLGGSNGYYDSNGTFILTVLSSDNNGANGLASTFCLSATEMQNLARRLFEPSIWEEFEQLTANPADALLSCMWMPVSKSKVMDGSGQIVLNKIETGITASYAKPLIEGSMDFPLQLPYYDPVTGSWQDYRNYPPYTEYSAVLPGVGEISLPAISIISAQDGAPTTTGVLRFALSTVDGKITWRICNKSSAKGQPQAEVMVLTGNIGTQVPITAQWQNIPAALTGAIQAVTGTAFMIGGGMAENPFMAIRGASQAISGVTSMISGSQQAYGGAGGLGGRTAEDLNKELKIIIRVYKLSEDPSKIGPVIGRPLYKRGRIGDFKGLIKVNGAFVECEATEEEHVMIAQFVNSSTNYIFGGLIVED